MDLQTIRTTLIDVLRSIQTDSGYDGTKISGSTTPLKDLEGFDSKIWPYAIGMLAKRLDVKIEDNKNIYCDPSGGRRLTIDESAKVILEMFKKG